MFLGLGSLRWAVRRAASAISSSAGSMEASAAPPATAAVRGRKSRRRSVASGLSAISRSSASGSASSPRSNELEWSLGRLIPPLPPRSRSRRLPLRLRRPGRCPRPGRSRSGPPCRRGRGSRRRPCRRGSRRSPCPALMKSLPLLPRTRSPPSEERRMSSPPLPISLSPFFEPISLSSPAVPLSTFASAGAAKHQRADDQDPRQTAPVALHRDTLYRLECPRMYQFVLTPLRPDRDRQAVDRDHSPALPLVAVIRALHRAPSRPLPARAPARPDRIARSPSRARRSCPRLRPARDSARGTSSTGDLARSRRTSATQKRITFHGLGQDEEADDRGR